MAEPYCGQIGTFAFTYVPYDWLLCDGSTLALQQFQMLAAIIGYSFGGSGTTFKLPNLQGQAMSGTGSGDAGYTAVYAQSVGHEFNSISPGFLPGHTHPVVAVNAPGTATPSSALGPVGNMPAQGYYSGGGPTTRGRNVYVPYASGNAVPMNGGTLSPAGTQNPQPSQLLVDNRQPYTPVIFAICTGGNWPTPQNN